MNYLKAKRPLKKQTLRGQTNAQWAGWHMAYPSLIPGTLYGPLSLLRVNPEVRARSKSCALIDVALRPKPQTKQNKGSAFTLPSLS